MYLLYSILSAIALLITSPYWLVRMLQDGKYRAGLKERLGSVPARLKRAAASRQSIWIHAVSVGEVLAISGLVNALRKQFPGRDIYISTTTLTGQTLAREKFGSERVFFLPLDLPFAINPFLAAIQPAMLVLAETEFWPNLLHIVKGGGCQIAVVNARISDRSLPGYRRFRFLLKRVLDDIDLFLAQTEVDHERLIAIGADAERVRVAGNLKFDVKAPAESALSRELRRVLQPNQRTLVFGSTVEGEEELLIPCFKSVLRDYPKALIILAPRHPERFDAVAELLHSSGLNFWRRSTWGGTALGGGVLLLDSIGELASVYSVADIAFVGGSLVPRGGHNILEPAQFAKPILVGPHYENFREIVRTFLAGNAVLAVNTEQLIATVLRLLQQPHEATQLGSRAFHVVEGGRGSTQRTLAAILELLDRQSTALTNVGASQQ
ncbi:MAG TPA: 3-deoxy-D-manno-octulosonic acid transferase [Terriglobales bacterium]|nr:3-deoxy-D-manno-octulosonic acid transferase [Terriglobales bacterium]